MVDQLIRQTEVGHPKFEDYAQLVTGVWTDILTNSQSSPPGKGGGPPEAPDLEVVEKEALGLWKDLQTYVAQDPLEPRLKAFYQKLADQGQTPQEFYEQTQLDQQRLKTLNLGQQPSEGTDRTQEYDRLRSLYVSNQELSNVMLEVQRWPDPQEALDQQAAAFQALETAQKSMHVNAVRARELAREFGQRHTDFLEDLEDAAVMQVKFVPDLPPLDLQTGLPQPELFVPAQRLSRPRSTIYLKDWQHTAQNVVRLMEETTSHQTELEEDHSQFLKELPVGQQRDQASLTDKPPIEDPLFWESHHTHHLMRQTQEQFETQLQSLEAETFSQLTEAQDAQDLAQSEAQDLEVIRMEEETEADLQAQLATLRLARQQTAELVQAYQETLADDHRLDEQLREAHAQYEAAFCIP